MNPLYRRQVYDPYLDNLMTNLDSPIIPNPNVVNPKAPNSSTKVTTSPNTTIGNELGIASAFAQGFNTLSDIAYNAETPLSDNRIYDVAMRGTAQDRHIGNKLGELFTNGWGLWGKTNREREIEDAVNYARNSGTDFSNMYSRGGSIDSLVNAWNPNLIQAHIDVPELTYENPDAYYAANEINRAIDLANYGTISSFDNARDTINRRNLRQNMMNYFADGGNLEGLNGIIKVNEGGTHSQNPYDGVTMGIAPDNIPNKVEEGEIVYKDYVYSNRLKPSKTLLKNNVLPEKYEGLTYAKVAEKIQKESEDRPNDPVSKRTLDEMMSRLMSAQEEQKAKIEERRLAKVIDEMPTEDKAALVASLMQQNQPQEGIDLSQPMYANGGKIFIKPSKRGTFTAAAKKRGMEVQEFASKVLANKDNYSPAMVKKATFARNVSKWHALGGHLFALGGEEDPFDFWAMVQRDNEARRANAPLAETPTPREEAILAAGTPEGQQAAYEYWKTTQDPELFRNATTPEVKSDTPTIPISGWQTMLRYAPVVGAGIGALVAGLQPVDYTYPNELRGLASQFRPISAPHIGGYRRYNPYDINLGDAENIALTAATLNANRGQNRATQGALNTAVINAAQRTTAQRNLAAQQVNEANRLTTDQYNLGIDQTNANLAQAYDQLNQQINNNRVNMLARAAQESDNTRTAWSNMYNATHENFFNQLGNVGRDEWNRNQFLSWLRQHPAVARDMGIDIR